MFATHVRAKEDNLRTSLKQIASAVASLPISRQNLFGFRKTLAVNREKRRGFAAFRGPSSQNQFSANSY